jgi:hypothetical protein
MCDPPEFCRVKCWSSPLRNAYRRRRREGGEKEEEERRRRRRGGGGGEKDASTRKHV